jgi:CRAL/TRIO domain
MTGFGLANMDYVPVKFMIRCFEANYPESLGSVLVHRAPWVFQGIWKVIKGWLDPVVASKIHFTNSGADLAAFLPEGEILKELGGTKDETFKFTPPVPGEDDKLADTESRKILEKKRKELVSDYEDIIQDWISNSMDTSPERDAKIRGRRDEVAAEITANYWQLDPYVRARSVYDRIGAIAPPKTVVASAINPAGGATAMRSVKLAVPALMALEAGTPRTSTSSADVFVDAQEELD